MDKEDIFIRRLQAEDIDRAVAIHEAAFPDYFLTFLGRDFLKLLYRFYIRGDEEIALAGLYQNHVVGTLLGTTQPQKFYRRLATRYFFRFAWAALKPFIQKPAILPRLLRALTYRGDHPPVEADGALLASICVDTGLQNQGVGKYLVAAFEREIFQRGVKFGYLITDRVNNDKTLTFYKKNGWHEMSEFTTQQGRPMVILGKFPGGDNAELAS
jgi:ribosomal protein S18 acetylase RimI-like enzyme